MTRTATSPAYSLADYEEARRNGRIVEGDEEPNATNKTRANALISATRRLDRDAREWAMGCFEHREPAWLWTERTGRMGMTTLTEWDAATGRPAAGVDALKVDA